MIKKLTQSFEAQSALLRDLINNEADSSSINDADIRIQNIIDSIRKLHVVTDEDIAIQLKFFIKLALPEQKFESQSGYSNTLEKLVDRYHGSEQKLAPNPVKKAINKLLKQG